MSDKLFDFGIECIRTKHKGRNSDEAIVAIRHVITTAQRALSLYIVPGLAEAKPETTPRTVLTRIEEREQENLREHRKQLVAAHKAYRTEIKFGSRNIDDVWFHELPAFASEFTVNGLIAIKLMKHAQPNVKTRVGDGVATATLKHFEDEAKKEYTRLVA